MRYQLAQLDDWYRIDNKIISSTSAGTEPSYPLVAVEVQVSGREKFLGVWGTWNDWGSDASDEAGAFSVSETAGSPREIRVRVRFKNDDLTIRDANGLSDAATWFTVYQAEHNSGTISLGALIFDSGSGEELNDPDARQQADYWVLADGLMRTMEDLGYPFKGELVIEHSWKNPSGLNASYCSPVDGVVHMNENDFNSYTLLHECMHRWLYDHIDGEMGLSDEALFEENQTHCLQDEGKSWIAFVEGFSHFCEDKLGEIMFGDPPDAPFSHYWLRFMETEDCGSCCGDIGKLERHCGGWRALFRLVTTPEICRYDYGTEKTADLNNDMARGFYFDPDIDFGDLLKGITGGSATGEIDKGDMNFEDFLDRLADANEDETFVTSETADAWLQLLEPSYSEYPVQPIDVFSKGKVTSTSARAPTIDNPLR